MTTQYIIFQSGITQQAVSALSGALVEAINDANVTGIYVGFASGGGDVTYGVSLYHVIRASPKQVTMHALGNMDSVAITVFLGASVRYAAPETRFFFHPIGFNTVPGQRLDWTYLNEKLTALHSDEIRLANIYKSATSLDGLELVELFRREFFHDCIWAVQNKVIHDIRPFMIPPGAMLRQIA